MRTTKYCLAIFLAFILFGLSYSVSTRLMLGIVYTFIVYSIELSFKLDPRLELKSIKKRLRRN